MSSNTRKIARISYLALMVSLMALILHGTDTSDTISVYAEDDDEDGERDGMEVERSDKNMNEKGSMGEMEVREDENEMEKGEDGDEDEGEGIGSGIAGTVLAVVVAAVAGTIGYTAWRVLRLRSKVKTAG